MYTALCWFLWAIIVFPATSTTSTTTTITITASTTTTNPLFGLKNSFGAPPKPETSDCLRFAPYVFAQPSFCFILLHTEFQASPRKQFFNLKFRRAKVADQDKHTSPQPHLGSQTF